MKQTNAYLLLGMLLVLFSCGKTAEDGVEVSGKVENPIKNEQVILSIFKYTGFEAVDTIEVDPSGAFSFNIKPTEASFYRMNFYNRQMVNLVLDGSEEGVEIMLEGNNPQGEVMITGSQHSKYVQQMEGILKDQQNDVQELNQQAIEARNNNDNETLERLTTEYYALMARRQKELKDFVYKISPSVSAVYGLESLPIEEHFTFYDSVAQKFKDGLPGNMFTVELNKRVDIYRKLAIGQPAPEISLPDPNGNVISLSSLRGNYVLIDFWAAWCRPCRMENPNNVRLYEMYSNRNFEILGVSLDKTKDQWVAAIQQDGLPWKHVSDLQYFNSAAAAEYMITSIPATYLIDPDGKIIAKGLRGSALAAKLKEIFG